MFPPSVECHRGALVPQLPLKAVMTISSGFARFTADRRFAIIKGIGIRQVGIGVIHNGVNNKNSRDRQDAFMPLGAKSSANRRPIVVRRCPAVRLGLTVSSFCALSFPEFELSLKMNFPLATVLNLQLMQLWLPELVLFIASILAYLAARLARCAFGRLSGTSPRYFQCLIPD